MVYTRMTLHSLCSFAPSSVCNECDNDGCLSEWYFARRGAFYSDYIAQSAASPAIFVNSRVWHIFALPHDIWQKHICLVPSPHHIISNRERHTHTHTEQLEEKNIYFTMHLRLSFFLAHINFFSLVLIVEIRKFERLQRDTKHLEQHVHLFIVFLYVSVLSFH